uniref:Uncharacterized protein n=1 Tax=uncultured marine virus TaxID=186617 RepID=A0A0F7L3J3_9VIRU|nr:hypothetical protein [uncultured marine virus]
MALIHPLLLFLAFARPLCLATQVDGGMMALCFLHSIIEPSFISDTSIFRL